MVDVPTQLAIASARIVYLSPQAIVLEKYIWSNFGLYAQGLRTHTTVPEDGILVAPDFPFMSAEDQTLGWEPFLAYFPPTMMTCMSIVTFQMPYQHPAFEVRFEMRLNGDLYRKQLAYGPPCCLSEAHDWIMTEEGE